MVWALGLWLFAFGFWRWLFAVARNSEMQQTQPQRGGMGLARRVSAGSGEEMMRSRGSGAALRLFSRTSEAVAKRPKT